MLLFVNSTFPIHGQEISFNIVPPPVGRNFSRVSGITQDINAFYACAERSRSAVSERQNITLTGLEDYKSTVNISTKTHGDRVEISVNDNGNCIPEHFVDKIFQPFFTTKPTGQGTGLGLSISYDIVKAHGGKFKVETNESEGCTFIITLPV